MPHAKRAKRLKGFAAAHGDVVGTADERCHLALRPAANNSATLAFGSGWISRRFATNKQRVASSATLDRAIGRWTAEHSVEAVSCCSDPMCCCSGVAACVGCMLRGYAGDGVGCAAYSRLHTIVALLGVCGARGRRRAVRPDLFGQGDDGLPAGKARLRTYTVEL